MNMDIGSRSIAILPSSYTVEGRSCCPHVWGYQQSRAEPAVYQWGASISRVVHAHPQRWGLGGKTNSPATECQQTSSVCYFYLQCISTDHQSNTRETMIQWARQDHVQVHNMGLRHKKNYIKRHYGHVQCKCTCNMYIVHVHNYVFLCTVLCKCSSVR